MWLSSAKLWLAWLIFGALSIKDVFWGYLIWRMFSIGSLQNGWKMSNESRDSILWHFGKLTIYTIVPQNKSTQTQSVGRCIHLTELIYWNFFFTWISFIIYEFLLCGVQVNPLIETSSGRFHIDVFLSLQCESFDVVLSWSSH